MSSSTETTSETSFLHLESALPCVYISPSLPRIIRTPLLKSYLARDPSCNVRGGSFIHIWKKLFHAGMRRDHHELHCIATVGTWAQLQSVPPETSTPEMKWSVRDVAACEEMGRKNVFILYCLVCFSLSMWWQSLSAGPSFSPMYFMMMSLRSSIRALPSISWGDRRCPPPHVKMWGYFPLNAV